MTRIFRFLSRAAAYGFFWLAAFFMLSLASMAHAQADKSDAPENAPKLLFIATSNVPKGKFHELAKMARPQGLILESRIIPMGSGGPVATDMDFLIS